MAVPQNPGLDAFWTAKPEVRQIILAHAERRVESTMTALNSLAQRLASVSGFLFAGAAVSANLAASEKVPWLASVMAAVGALMFALGGLISLVGLFSPKVEWPGETPSWWLEQGPELLAGLDREGAEFWVAGHYETVIAKMARVNGYRANVLSWALLCGGLGGVCIAAAAWAAVLKS